MTWPSGPLIWFISAMLLRISPIAMPACSSTKPARMRLDEVVDRIGEQISVRDDHVAHLHREGARAVERDEFGIAGKLRPSLAHGTIAIA